MAKLTTNHQGLILSPTGEAWFAPTPGFEEAVSLTPPRSTIETTTGVGKPRMRDIYLPETRQLLQEADPTAPPAWSVLPPSWTLPVPINRPPCILINGAENTMGEILEISERLLSLSLQAVHSRLDILALPGGLLLRGSMDEFSRQTVGPMILFRADSDQIPLLRRLQATPRRVPVIALHWDRYMVAPQGWQKTTLGEVEGWLDQIEATGNTLPRYGAQCLAWWAMRRYESLQFGLEPEDNRLPPW